jgi:iron(III) transport system ATP-binding protein
MVELEFRAVSKRFDDGHYAVRDLSFTAPGGQLTTLLGPSGCGKTTLLRMAAGLVSPTEGRVLVDGRDITTLAPEERNVSLLFQDYALFPHLDVLGNVSFGLRMSGVAPRRAEERALGVLELLGLSGLERRRSTELSGGQQQRVALARALALEPSVVLLDEPLSNLDDRLRRQMREEIRTLQRRLGLTVAYVTHDEAEAMAVSDVIVVINEGRLLQVGTPREVYERPNCEFVAGFMGDAAVFEVTLDADGMVMLGSLRLALPLPAAAELGGPLRLLVRPEAWRIVAVGLEGLPGRIVRAAYLGHGAEYRVDSDLGELLVSCRHAEALHQPGAPVSLTLAGRGVTLLSGDAAGPSPGATHPRPVPTMAGPIFSQ